MNNIQILHNTIDNLYNQYKDNEHILSKLQNWIVVQLPKKLDNDNTRKIERIERKRILVETQVKFTRKFLKKHIYFYIPSTEMFFTYDKIDYTTLREDDINHKILTTISSIKGDLMQWKYKIKTNICKTIKNTSLYNAIPESITIQKILANFFPIIFKSKNETKYFLTVIGDIITKTHNDTSDLVFIISYKAKNFIRDIANLIWIYTGTNILNHIKFKYHEQKYDIIRLITINDTVELNAIWSPIKDNIINLIVVSCFYSYRFKGSEEFLNKECDSEKKQHILYLKNNTTSSIISQFSDLYIEKCEEFYTVPWKNMLFLWKIFLEDNELPNVMFVSTLKSELISKFQYDESTDSFTGITSLHLPFVSKFIDFWNSYFYVNTDEIEFEVYEINQLFKRSCFSSNKITFDDKKIINVLNHYIENINIEEDKYVYGWSCKLWNKEQDIDNVIEIIKDKQECISIYDAYSLYTKSNENNPYIVSKRYFEKFLEENYHDNIDDDDLVW